MTTHDNRESRKAIEEEIELRDIERRLRAYPSHRSSEVLALLVCVLGIVASVAGFPLSILGVIAVTRRNVTRRNLLNRAAELDHP